MQNEIKTDYPMGEDVRRLFSVGAHFALSRARRHPSTSPYIFGRKNRVEIFDLEKTTKLLDEAVIRMKELGSEGKIVLFAAGKGEARDIMKAAAERVGMPYIAGRWIGGTLTNFSEIRGRIDRLEALRNERERGEFSKYTKRERLMLDREIERLAKLFNGLVPLTGKPHALFVIDAAREYIAVKEAKVVHVPVIAFSNSDCDLSLVDTPILGNDTSKEAITLVVNALTDAYADGAKSRPRRDETSPGTKSE